MPSPVEILVRFALTLREEGLPVATDRITSFVEAAALTGELYWPGRATLVSRRADIDTYDRVFDSFFGGRRPPPVVVERAPAAEVVLASTDELLRDEPVPADRAALDFDPPPRRTRRTGPAPAGSLDLRRTIRRSFRTGGEPLERAWRARRKKPRRLVLLLDISGSMSDYSHELLRAARAVLHADRRHEAFAFGTRLTRLSRADTIPDWRGGTRIGETLQTFLRDHGNLARGSVVVICSDGLDVGDPELLGSQMARLHRLSHKVVWLNPLKADPRYEPLTRGMQAALPHVDVFAAGHELSGLVL